MVPMEVPRVQIQDDVFIGFIIIIYPISKMSFKKILLFTCKGRIFSPSSLPPIYEGHQILVSDVSRARAHHHASTPTALELRESTKSNVIRP